jgi:hypothetical protein
VVSINKIKFIFQFYIKYINYNNCVLYSEMGKNKANIPLMLGEAIFYSSIQFSIGSVELSSKFSVINFCTSQAVLDNAAEALKGYIYVASLWMVGTALVMYAKYSWYGVLAGLIANLVCMLWIYFSYIYSFKIAAEKYKLKVPCVFFC